MRFRLVLPTFYALLLCWYTGAHLAAAETSRRSVAREQPYRAVMREAENRLRQMGIAVEDPQILPNLMTCGACLDERHAFGAFTETSDTITLPASFDIATIEGRSILIHEYGHYLLTRIGMPAETQETICLRLGNAVYETYFTSAAN